MKQDPLIAATKRYYEKHGDPWINLKTNSFYNETPFRKLVSFLPTKGTALDIGCAAGVHVPLFLGIGRHLKYVGVDISRNFIKVASRRYPQLPFVAADIAAKNTLPFPNRKFVGFFSGSTLQHIPFTHWDTMFDNIEALMKPGAVGFISLPTEHTVVEKDTNDTRHFTIMSPEEHTRYFKKRGYKILAKGMHDGYAKKGIWRWYIVQLPK